MKYIFLSTGVFFLAGIPALFSIPTVPLPETSKEPIQEQQLSLQEQVGQMLLIGFEGTALTPELAFLLHEVQPGGVLLLGRNIEDKQQLKELISDLQNISPIPLFIAVDQEGGLVSRIFWGESTASFELQDAEHAFQVGKKRAKELKETGITMNLAPVLDSKTPGDFLFFRFFQKDEKTSLMLAQSLVRGHQEEGVVPVPKHFPGYDGISFNPEEGIIPLRAGIPDTSLFQTLFQDVSLPVVMISHVAYRELDFLPFPFSAKGVAFLKEKLGKDVLIMSDDLLSKSMRYRYSLSEIGKKAVSAGVDILLVAGYPQAETVMAFSKSLVHEAEKNEELRVRIEVAAAKILQFKEFSLP
tara:strand:- start:4223 stop:5290 length:1068 start_codon:yes stop_codon:yes gene_type:complete